MHKSERGIEMKKIRVISKVIAVAAFISLIAMYPITAYASEKDVNELFQAKLSIVDEINAEFGLDISISLYEGEDYLDVDPLTVEEFRTFLISVALQQQDVYQQLERMLESEAAHGNESYEMFSPFSTFLRQTTFHGQGVAIWNTGVVDNVRVYLSASILADVFGEGAFNRPHVRFPGDVRQNRVNQLWITPSAGTTFTHAPSTIHSTHVQNHGSQVVVIYQTLNLTVRAGLIIVNLPGILHDVTFNIH